MKRNLSICIVTADIVGPIRNGGIGTAYYYLALALARAGHRVTVLYTLGQHCEHKTIDYWREAYERDRIEFVPLPPCEVRGHHAIKTSYAVYQWLKTRRFDLVHCHEWRGVGFYTALAKRQGLCLEEAILCVGAHSPTLWHLEGMNERADADALEVDFMERESVALADVLWSPTDHMVAWMRREGWTLPKRIVRKQYLMLDLPPHATRPVAAPDPELVFFGRLETRKGLDLFCHALDRLAARGVSVPSVTFLGKTASVDGIPSEAYLHRRAAKWTFPWKIVSGLDRDAALEYLRAGNRIAVLPSRVDNLPYAVLECLSSGIPCLATAIGGIPEMVRPADHDRALFPLDPEALANRLQDAIASGLAAAPMRISPERTHADWLQWHAMLPRSRRRTRKAGESTPLVSVCLTHRNRPGFLAHALDSLRAQDYPRLEVVLVDDGSDLPEALAYLDGLAAEFAARQWHIVQQCNRYPGAARNAGIAVARGDLLMFMDDDNLARPHEISTFVRAAQHSPADIFTCFLSVFQSAEPAPQPAVTDLWPFLGGAIVPGMRRNVFGDANALYRRRVFDRIGGFTEDFGVGCEDWEFFARAALAGVRIDVVPEPLVLYRQTPSGVHGSTPARANQMRVLRPYFENVPAHLRGLVHLAPLDTAAATGGRESAPRLDHVQRAVVFGSGEAGRLAINLASRCGWDVPWIVDNNPAMWNQTAHGRVIRAPESLTTGSIDLVIVASMAGKPAISAQLRQLGFSAGQSFVHFLDPVRVNGTTLQITLP